MEYMEKNYHSDTQKGLYSASRESAKVNINFAKKKYSTEVKRKKQKQWQNDRILNTAHLLIALV